MTVLLTGATGFIGKRVLSILLERQHRVIALGRNRPEQSHPNLQFVGYDFAGPLTSDAVDWSRIDAVAHLAAAGVKATNRSWATALEMNVVGTQRLLYDIHRYAVQRPTFLMTRTFYENLCGQVPQLSENPYISSKATASRLVELWSRAYEGPVVLGTIFQAYGPGDNPENVLSYAARQIKAGQPALFGSGIGLRDWIFVEDAARAIVGLIERRPSAIEQWDIGSGVLHSIRYMIECMARLVESRGSELSFDPTRDRQDVAVSARAERTPPGWVPRVGIESGLVSLLEQV